jgi:hypothetical protein
MSKPKETKATKAPEDPWKELTLPTLLKGLSKDAIRTWEKEGQIELNVPHLKEEDLKIEKKITNEDEASSDAKRFLKESSDIIYKILKDFDLNKIEKKLKRTLSDQRHVEKAIDHEEIKLLRCLPDFSGKEAYRWPGPIGYRAAFNHLIAVTLRVHSSYPQAQFNHVILATTRRIIVPALAHNLTFLRKKHPNTYKRLLKNETGIQQLFKGKKISLEGLSKLESEEDEELWLYRKWVRLLNVSLNSTDAISKSDKEILFKELAELVLEYETSPTTSRLWSELSLLATSDLSIDEMLVSRVVADLNANQQAGQPSTKPLIFCARARFGLLKYSHNMQKERKDLEANTEVCLKKCESIYNTTSSELVKDSNKALNKANSEILFGWAYLLSRYALLGHDHQTKIHKDYLENASKCSKLLDLILSLILKYSPQKAHCHTEDNEELSQYPIIALRYLAGYWTNPRFIRDINFEQKASYYINLMEEKSTLHEGQFPLGIISLMKARLKLHTYFKDKNDKDMLKKCLSDYADVLKSLPAKADTTSTIDGEVAAWGIPELCYAISLYENFYDSDYNLRESQKAKVNAIIQGIMRLGEIYFGVYFNTNEENQRIEAGIKLALKS